MTTDHPDGHRVVIIGAGHGGGSVAALLRQYGFSGPITLIGDEQAAPYHRPPLSKAWLKGTASAESLALKPADFYATQDITLRVGLAAEAIDRDARRVALADGSGIGYDTLILATGAHARPLPRLLAGAGHANVLTLRNIADADRLKHALGSGKRLVIVGGGYIGLECAASARALGAEAVVVEHASRLLERVASAPIADFLRRYHEKNGVRFVFGAQVETIEGEGTANAVTLVDGQRFDCDAILVGIGAAPNTSLAEQAGLCCDDGITVDADCRTSDPHIFAIGDAVRRPHPLYGRSLRLESVPSAMEQAKHAAAAIAGREPPALEVPWFWSDQYDLKLQITGLPFDADAIVVRGDPESGRFGVYHLRDGSVVTVEAINSPPDFFAGKKLIASGKAVAPAQLADTAVPLNDIAA